MPTWTPVVRDEMTVSGGGGKTFGAGDVSEDFTIKSGTTPGANITSGAQIKGVQVQCDASAGAGHAATIIAYDGPSASGNILYVTTIDLSVYKGGTDTLSTGIPFFDTITYTLTDVAGGGGKEYTVQFFVQATT